MSKKHLDTLDFVYISGLSIQINIILQDYLQILGKMPLQQSNIFVKSVNKFRFRTSHQMHSTRQFGQTDKIAGGWGKRKQLIVLKCIVTKVCNAIGWSFSLEKLYAVVYNKMKI